MRSAGILKLAIALTIGLLTFGSMASATKRTVAVAKTMADLKLDASGFVDVAEDGVARSYAGDGTTVIDYVQLDPAALANFVATLPPTMSAEQKADVKNAFVGVNGLDVKNNAQLVNPPASLRPAPVDAFTEEQFTSANEAFVASKKLDITDGLPACVGQPCQNNAA